MAESVIADFVGSVHAEDSRREEPAAGRVVLSEQRLVLAVGEEDALTIPLDAIYDVAVGHVPPELGDFFNSTVTIAYADGDRRRVVAVEADDEPIEKFGTVLFKAILNGTTVTVKDEARVGGRVSNDDFHSAELYLSPGRVAFRHDGGRFAVELRSVTEFERTSREVHGEDCPVLLVRHMHEGRAVTTLVAMQSSRKLSVLGRYLRLEYTEIMADLRELVLSDAEIEALVVIYSAGGTPAADLAGVIDVSDGAVSQLLADLADEGLLEDPTGTPRLTAKGEVVASRYLDTVNE